MKLSEILSSYDLGCIKFKTNDKVYYALQDKCAMNIFGIEDKVLTSVENIIDNLDNFIFDSDVHDIAEKYYEEEVPNFDDLEAAVNWLKANHPDDSYIEKFEAFMKPDTIEDDYETLSETECVAKIYNACKMSVFEYSSFKEGYEYILDNYPDDTSFITIMETILTDNKNY